MDMIQTLAQELNKDPRHVENVVRLLDEGNTIPFIARYRKELHGAMDDTSLRTLEERLQYLRGLEERRDTVKKSIEEHGTLTEELPAAIHSRVQAARKRQQERYRDEGITSNAELSARQLEVFCPLDDACRELIGRACDKYNLSMRAVSRVRKVARTIADLAGEEQIAKAHLLEALRYRNLEGNYWK